MILTGLYYHSTSYRRHRSQYSPTTINRCHKNKFGHFHKRDFPSLNTTFPLVSTALPDQTTTFQYRER